MRNRLLLAMWIGAMAPSLAACDEQETSTVEQTFGPSPTLPAPEHSWAPTVNVATAIGWPAGGKPTPAKGMAVNAFATGLDHPRTLYVLPNGDVLVAETNAPPKPDDSRGIKGWITKMVMGRAGAGTTSANRITLLRDADGDGVAETKNVFLEGLHSPFGMALVGDDFYVAELRCDHEISLPCRRYQNHRGRRETGGPARGHPSIITGPRISPPVPMGRSFMRPSAPTAMSAKTASRPRPIAPPFSKSIARPARRACSRPACAIRTGHRGSRKAARCGWPSTSATNSATISCPTT